MQACLGIIEAYLAIFRTLCDPCIYNRAIFKTLTCLEPEASSKAYQKIIIYILRALAYSEQYIQAFSKIFEDIQGY